MTVPSIFSIFRASAKVMVSKGIVRERPTNTDEATEFINGNGLSMDVLVDAREILRCNITVHIYR